MQDNELRVLSVQGVRRLPYYLKFLKEMQAKGTAFVPAISIADSLGIYEVQVRKDLAAVSSSPGKPRVGFSVDGLIADIEHFLGYDNANLAALVGAGNLGKALLSYGGFAEYGLDIAAAFDTDPALAGQCIPWNGLRQFAERRISPSVSLLLRPTRHRRPVTDWLRRA